jgi:hypothetical protein
MKKDVIRTSFDLTADTLRQADEIVKRAKLDSRKQAVEWSIRLGSQVVEAVQQGLRLVVVNKDGEKRDFHLDTPNVEEVAQERLIVARISQENLYRLLEVTKNPQHPAAQVSLHLATASLRPHGPHKIEARLFISLAYFAVTLGDPAFLKLVCDVMTGCLTNCMSFDELVSKENFRPAFDLNFIEQQFLSDEYQKEKRKRLLPPPLPE